MNQDYVWTFSAAALASGLSGPFSLEYHVPGSKLKVAPSTIVGSRIWLVVQSDSESYLYGLLSPSIIELYKEGSYEGDFLVRCEPFSSLRFLPRHEASDPWLLPFQGVEEIRECTSEEQSVFLEMIRKNHRVGFVQPSRAILESVPRTSFSDLEHAVPDQLALTLRTIAFGDASRPRFLPDSISAFGGITLAILKSTHPHLNEAGLIGLIAALDPMARMAEDEPLKPTGDILRALSSLPPVVDTFLEEIDPEKIAPREFVAKAPDTSLEWLDKTNDAEQAHERMLKDLVLYLKSIGFRAYRTRSFDLYAEKAGTKLLWEIKSANEYNTNSQGEKGIIQLLRYSTALAGEGHGDVKFLLLLQDSKQAALYQYLDKMAGRIGAELWLYDEASDWPVRVFNSASKVPLTTKYG